MGVEPSSVRPSRFGTLALLPPHGRSEAITLTVFLRTNRVRSSYLHYFIVGLLIPASIRGQFASSSPSFLIWVQNRRHRALPEITSTNGDDVDYSRKNEVRNDVKVELSLSTIFFVPQRTARALMPKMRIEMRKGLEKKCGFQTVRQILNGKCQDVVGFQTKRQILNHEGHLQKVRCR
jgi:hypothetical protein